MVMAINMMAFGRPRSHKLFSNMNTDRQKIRSGKVKRICGTISFNKCWFLFNSEFTGLGKNFSANQC